MKERPIIFNPEMVRAILDGRKTQTRRVIKLSHERGMVNPVIRGRNGEISSISCRLAPTLCPFGQVGDQLWVRETFGTQVRRDGLGGTGEFRVYRASNPDAVKYTTACGKSVPVKWTPSIHMPRWASRITLEITAVRVERLNSISDGDAINEGCSTADMKSGDCVADVFARLWSSIYGGESCSANPWVWVIEFHSVEVRDANKNNQT